MPSLLPSVRIGMRHGRVGGDVEGCEGEGEGEGEGGGGGETGGEGYGCYGEGELLVKTGSSMFGGYFEAPDETRAAFSADGYYKTGDLVRISPAARGAGWFGEGAIGLRLGPPAACAAGSVNGGQGGPAPAVMEAGSGSVHGNSGGGALSPTATRGTSSLPVGWSWCP